jgi:hypothetical protein
VTSQFRHFAPFPIFNVFFSETVQVCSSFRGIKGIVQPFELGGETTLIRSAVKYWKAGMF